MSKLADKVQQDLIRAIDQDELVLPTLPEVALQVREAAEDPDVSIQALSKVIGNDAALTARIIRVVNSPLLRSPKEITDLQMAISRLGINYTCNLATGLAMEQMFQATSDVVDRKMREVWNKSTEIAGICHALCRHYTRLAPDQATLAGLVHQIGALPILTYAEEHSELLADSISLNHVIERIHPLIGERIHGPIGHAVDIFAILGTVFGVATSLGYGVLQINSGFHHLFGLPVNPSVQIVLIAITCGLATLSVASGLDKGIRILSELNLGLAAVLLLFVLLLGPTVFLLQTYVQNTGAYLSDIVYKTFNLYAYQPTDWIGGWTLLYWGWWLSWSPFVGLFIARISRGRTIREFVCGVLFVPAGFTLLWMTVFGDSAIHMILTDGVQDLAAIVDQDSSLALFAFLEHFPLSSVVSMVAVLMVVVFFVTSADSGALVVDMLASSGHDHSPLWQRIFWSVSIGVVAIALLLANGLKALQTATIASALPFSIILLASIWGLFRALHLDATRRGLRNQALPSPRQAPHAHGGWQRRLRNIAMLPRRAHVTRFIAEVARPACEEVAVELRKQGYEVTVSEREDGRVSLELDHAGEGRFLYEVRPRAFTTPSFVMRDTEESSDARKYFRAEVHLREGGQDYDIMGWSRDDVISDILDQYERHLHYLHVVG